ncbi:hypothetical protein ACJIZ3_009821 [Penstemon smallii]|uniref:Protein IQ-DOMAIN 1 n=1 Tax=Penstemon smallii TaxID=265156 RepID=A0ABD3TDL1_9LAMI
MGITGELVRNVFSKRLSIQRHENRGKRNSAERKKWSISVRSYLCGDENNNSSFAADEDSVSVNLANPNSSFRSNMATNYSTCTNAEDQEDSASEATVNQPALHEEDNNSKDHDEIYRRNQKDNSTCKLFKQEDAAVIIQTAFRSFQARRATTTASDEKAKREDEILSIGGTSIEVQTGENSSDIFSLSFDVCHSTRNRARPQVLKLQNDWDDSTVSSTKSKMRIQNRLEAATRRERALAYAFSQQLRICSKKKQSSCDETNMGWNWLERWMAARQPENDESMMEDEIVVDNYNNEKPVLVAKKRLMDAGAGAGLIEEKESCGSNEVSSSQFEVNINNIINVPIRPSIPRTKNKLTRNLSKQNSSASTH